MGNYFVLCEQQAKSFELNENEPTFILSIQYTRFEFKLDSRINISYKKQRIK